MPGLTQQAQPSGTVNMIDPMQVFTQPLSGDQLVNLDFLHYLHHIGRFYGFSHYVSIAQSAQYYMAFETGADLVHLVAEYRVSQDFKWESMTGFTYTAGSGTVITPLNERFDVRGNPAYTCLSQARFAPTVTVPGTVAATRYLPSGGKGIGSTVGFFGVEWILDANTQYLFRYTNLTNQDAIFNLLVNFYELNLPV
jgi:hypothetical protein